MSNVSKNTLTLLLIGYFVIITINTAFLTPFSFDHAIFSMVAKNIADGYGFAASYPDKTPFFAMSSGPLVLLSSAASIYLFGNTLWAPSLGMSIFNLSLLALIITALRKNKLPWRSLSICLLIIFTCYEGNWWQLAVGEVGAFLLFLVAAILSTSKEPKTKTYIILGVLCGLSILTRSSALPGFGGIAIYLLIQLLLQKKSMAEKSKALITVTVIGISALIITLTPFKLFEINNVNNYGYTADDLSEFKSKYYQKHSSTKIIYQFNQTKLSDLQLNFAFSHSVLQKHVQSYGLGKYGVYGLFTFILFSLFVLRKKQRKPTYQLIAVCSLALFCYFFWTCILSSTVFERYFFHLMLLTLICTAITITLYNRTLAIIIACCWVLLIPEATKAPPTAPSLKHRLTLKSPSDLPQSNITLYNRFITETAQHIQTHSFPTPIASCGWYGAAREIEYALPNQENIKDCFLLIDNSLNSKTRKWKQPVNLTIVRNNITWAIFKNVHTIDQRYFHIYKACEKNIVFTNMFFSIMDCPFAELKKQIPLDSASPFFNKNPFLWMPPKKHITSEP